MKRIVFFGLGMALLGGVLLSFQGKNGIGGEQGNANAEYAIGLCGDVPYSDVQATLGVPNMIADMNSQKLAFTVNDGDLKQGSGSCDNIHAWRQRLDELRSQCWSFVFGTPVV